MPDGSGAAIVHGDYRLDNLLIAQDGGSIRAVLDWEMSTLGDPLADLGVLLVYWQQSDDARGPRGSALPISAVTQRPGFPGRSEIARWYGERTGRDLSRLPWYVAFGFFKLSVVCAGIAARGRAGVMVGTGFVEAGEQVAPLARLGHAVLDGELS